MVAHEPQKRLGSGTLGTERGKAPSRFAAALSGLDDLAFALDADSSAATVESGAAVLFRAGKVDCGTAAALDAPVSLFEGLERGRVLEVDSLEVIEDSLLILFDRSDDIVGAPFEKPAGGLMLSAHRVYSSDAARDVDAVGEVPHGGNLVALRVDLDLPEHRAGPVFDGRGCHPPPVLSLSGSAADVLAVHGERRVLADLLRRLQADGVGWRVGRVGRQVGEDVMEGRIAGAV